MKKNKEESRSIQLIKKSNDLVEGRYRFDIWETRVFTKMLTMIKKDDEDFKEYRIYLKDVVKDFGISHKNSYKMLKDGAKGLTKKEIRIIRDTPEGLKEFQTHIAVGVDSFVKDGNYLDISFHPKMKPFLLQLQSQFLMYDIRNVLSIQSSFSVRIYELLKQYEKIGKRRFSVIELKEMLDIVDKYPLYANFKQRVILKAQEDLGESTDIRFRFEEIKSGKQVTELIFFISKNTTIVASREDSDTDTVEEMPNESELTHLVEREIFSMVRDFKGANPKTIQKWLKLYPAEYVKSRITLVKNLIQVGQKVANPMGFIQSMMLQPDIFDPIQEEKDKQAFEKEQNRKKQLEIEAQKEKEQKLANLKQEFELEKVKLMTQVFDADPTLTHVFFEEFKAQREKESPAFMVQLAYDYYERNIDGIAPMSKEEILHNYQLGGSFGVYFSEWFEERFQTEVDKLKGIFERKWAG